MSVTILAIAGECAEDESSGRRTRCLSQKSDAETAGPEYIALTVTHLFVDNRIQVSQRRPSKDLIQPPQGGCFFISLGNRWSDFQVV
jgi:hypothetical protein